ncbi:hypothetical protein D7V97_03885 [Corallococcus sp. CA053C]|nr:hypothetical protein D7V97_03885 [Corallococcus sp. CA053C]
MEARVALLRSVSPRVGPDGGRPPCQASDARRHGLKQGGPNSRGAAANCGAGGRRQCWRR